MPMDGSRLDEASNSTRAPGQKARAAGSVGMQAKCLNRSNLCCYEM
jgi:hypothetical protein